MKFRSIRIAALSVFLLSTSALFVSAQSHSMNMGDQLSHAELMALISNAKTAQDHLKLASYFRNEAMEHENEAKEHEEMAGKYDASPVAGTTTELEMHCKEIADSARRIAASDNAMAQKHQAIAEQLEQHK